LIRDPGPIHNIGYGVTSRDVPVSDGETQGDSPNSGYVSRALNGHPIMRFFASTAATVVGTYAASKLTKSGGIKLAKYLQDTKENSAFSSKIIKSVTDIRKHLDELQGVNRYVGGEDPYSNLVFEMDGKYTTGYDGVKSERFGYRFLTEADRKSTGSLYETPAVWSFKDEVQQRLIRAGRRLPYELPAMYGVQRAITDPLFGENTEGDKKVNWFNPVDVMADFVKQSTINMATIIAPFEFAGAGVSAARSSLHTLRYSMNDMRSLTGNDFKKKMHDAFIDVSDLLAEVGHDFATLSNKFIKTSAQTTGGFSAAAEVFKNNESGFVQTLNSLRHGQKAAMAAEQARNSSKAQIKKVKFETLFKSREYTDPITNTTQISRTAFDFIPAFTGLKDSISKGVSEFKLLGKSYDLMQDTVAYNRLILDRQGIANGKELLSGINRIQSMHRSRLSSLAQGLRVMGAGGPGDGPSTSGEFFIGQRTKSLKDLLEQQLINKGVAAKEARSFVDHADIRITPSKKDVDITNILTIGKSAILKSDSSEDFADDFFGQVLKRYGQRASSELLDQTGLNVDVLKQSIEDSRNIFVSKEFQKGLNNSIRKDWNKFYREDLTTIASTVLKPRKPVFQDFVGPLTSAKQQFLQRKTAQTLGIRLLNDDGTQVANEIVNKELRNRGFDPNGFIDLRAFLIKNRKMTTGITGAGYNIFGLRPVTIDEARTSNRFKHLPKEDQKIIENLSSRMAIDDPVSKSIGASTVGGLYQAKSGQILDFSSIKNTFSNTGHFFAGQFQIPILGFNPADLFGYRSFAEMARRSPVQYVSGRTVQPFVKEADDSARADFYMWHKTKASKGKVLRYSNDVVSDSVYSSELSGTYRAIATNSSDLITRHARDAAGYGYQSTDQISGKSRSTFLNKIFKEENQRRQDKLLRFKKAFSIDAEQPNSIFGFASRFVNRKKDLNNSVVMSKLLSLQEIDYLSNGVKRKIRLDPNTLTIVDETGSLVSEFTQSDILKGYSNLRQKSFQYGLPEQVIKKLEQSTSDLFTYGGKRVSEISSDIELIEFAQQLVGGSGNVRAALKQAGVEPRVAEQMVSRISSLIQNPNLRVISALSEKSPTITTRIDELKQEIFRYISQVNGLKQGKSHEIFIEIQKAIDNLSKSNLISPGQKAEAQAAGLSTMFNINAFKTFDHRQNVDINAVAAVKETLDIFIGNKETRQLLTPFSSGTIAEISGGSIRKKFSPLLGPLRSKFGMGEYQPNDLGIDPLGSGQAATLVPTFGTVFGRDPFGAVKSALGFGSYANPDTFSTGSIPMMHSVERLNRYFGTLGMQLDVSDFKGPIDLYLKGMVGKRVLPIYAAGTTALTVDRTLGGMVNEKDERGERVYSPLILGEVAKGAVEIQSLFAHMTPGGMNYQEKKEQLVEGEVPIRQGRYWPLGNTPFKGGKIMYYRPSWYQKLQGGAAFTSDTYGSPLEKALFYNDISPLRPFDPYRFERKHYYDRPYPVSGEYFSGPFGPAVPLANMTIGRILKPQIKMHEEEVQAGLSQYAPAGEFGAYNAAAYNMGQSYSYGVSGGSQSQIAAANAGLASMAGSLDTAKMQTRSAIGQTNAQYIDMLYGPPKVPGVMPPKIVPSGQPMSPANVTMQTGELGYKMQEMAGIYGFAFSSLREKLGFGQGDFEPQRSVLQSASKAYGTSRAFWDLNLGGLGDVPLPSREAIGNIEFSEIVRRFIPKERSGVDYINPIQNLMGQQYPFLPGSEYFTDFKTGDPFTKVQEGEIRLPGVGYERFNRLYSDETGAYGAVSQLDILGDIAPYSKQYRDLNKRIDGMGLSPDEKIKVEQIRGQVENTTKRYEFSPYQYKGFSAEELGVPKLQYAAGRMGEFIAHSDNFVASKILGRRTAVEDWERRNVYGTTFPEWQRPFESYIKPMINKSTQENPITAAATLGFIGSMFGRTPGAKLFGTLVGATTGAASSIFGNIYEAATGDRFIPQERKKEIALEEYTDILSYVKNVRLANQAKAEGNSQAANQYLMASKRTMYGADLEGIGTGAYGTDIESLSLAIPKRKREHFKAMIQAPPKERENILSTAGRLERRIYEAAWGMQVEKKPELEDYFTRHELPDASWEGWHPNTNIDSIKIKVGQSMGLEMSQMGYYPQQIKEANLTNPSYPNFNFRTDRQDTLYRLRSLMSEMNLTGSVSSSPNPFGSEQMNISAGVR